MHFRVIQLQTNSASMNMAIDEAIYNAVDQGKSPATIRFYKWKPSSISIGRNQNINIVNTNSCKENEIDLVRRPTGGNLVYHDQRDLTYSVICPLSEFKDLRDAYKEICSWMIKGFKKLGITAEFLGKNDVVCNGKKISGNAQHNTSKTILQHGAIFFHPSHNEWLNYTNFDFFEKPEEVKNKLKEIEFIQNILTSINPKNTERINEDIFYKKISSEFLFNSKVTSFEIGVLTDEELREAERLARDKYASEAWTKGTGSEKQGDLCAIDVRAD